MQGCVVFSVSRVEGEFCVSQFKSLSGSGSEGPESLPASKALVRHVFVSMCVCVCVWVWVLQNDSLYCIGVIIDFFWQQFIVLLLLLILLLLLLMW